MERVNLSAIDNEVSLGNVVNHLGQTIEFWQHATMGDFSPVLVSYTDDNGERYLFESDFFDTEDMEDADSDYCPMFHQGEMMCRFEVNFVVGEPFVEHVDQLSRPTISNAKQFVEEKYRNPHSFGLDSLKSYGFYKEQGYLYNFNGYLKSYVYKQHGEWCEAFAPSRVALRTSTIGKIDKILDND